MCCDVILIFDVICCDVDVIEWYFDAEFIAEGRRTAGSGYPGDSPGIA